MFPTNLPSCALRSDLHLESCVKPKSGPDPSCFTAMVEAARPGTPILLNRLMSGMKGEPPEEVSDFCAPQIFLIERR